MAALLALIIVLGVRNNVADTADVISLVALLTFLATAGRMLARGRGDRR